MSVRTAALVGVLLVWVVSGLAQTATRIEQNDPSIVDQPHRARTAALHSPSGARSGNLGGVWHHLMFRP